MVSRARTYLAEADFVGCCLQMSPKQRRLKMRYFGLVGRYLLKFGKNLTIERWFTKGDMRRIIQFCGYAAKWRDKMPLANRGECLHFIEL